jgi:2,4-dienoyl-CoA reductase-like NADH-dependent reductase (Old Yellow Enzyme family)/thioredoxin reductase
MMAKKTYGSFPNLFEPGYIGNLKVKNRLIRAAMMTFMGALDGSVTERTIRHYRQLALGGVGLVIVEYSYVDRKSSKANHCQLSVADNEYISGLAWLAMTIKQNGAMAGLQLSHAGGQRYLMTPSKKVPSRSLWEAIQGKGESAPEELTVEEIGEIVDAFGDAALRAKKACFDMVEVHGCHGYLITEFLSPLTNKRTDRYGGSFDNRMRLLIEIIQNIRKKVGSDYPLVVRLNGSEYLEGGITIEESIETARALEKNGVNAVHVSGGTHRNGDKLVVPMYWPQGYHVWATEEIKKAVGIPVIASGSVTTPDFAEEILKEGKADFVSLARPLVADPFFPKKAEQGRPEDIAPCIRCNMGCEGHPEGALTCTVNISVGREEEFKIKEAIKPKRVAVIGGGPAGMEAARIAAMRGHEVTLFEKRKLGGMLIEASIPEFKENIRSLIKYLSGQIEKLGVKVIYEEAVAEVIKKSGVNAVIIAGGATPIVPDVPGIDKSIAVGALEVLNGARVGNEVLVIGGGLVGCETALFLAERKKKVTIVEMLDQILLEMNVAGPRLAFVERLNKQNVKIEINKKLEEIVDDGIIISDREGKKSKLRGDTVVLALGLKANTKLFNELVSLEDIDVYSVGDSGKPSNIYDAIHEGHLVARNL